MSRLLDCFVLSNHVLWLDRRHTQLPVPGDCFECEDIFLEEGLENVFFQIISEALAMNGLVPLIVMIEAVLFCSRM